MAPVKRHAYEAQFKLQAISYAVVNGNRAAAKKFNVNESMVRKWRKQENELRQVNKTRRSFRGNKARWPQLEDHLEQWIIEQRTAGRSVSTVTIRLKATKIAQAMKLEHFQGGPSWCVRFMKRRHLSIRPRTTMAQQLPVDYKERRTSTRLKKPTFTVVLGCQDFLQQHVYKKEEEEVPTDQQLCKEETNSSLVKEDSEHPHMKEEPEEIYTSQERERFGLKQETETLMLSLTCEEKDNSNNQTLYMKSVEHAALDESVANMPVISSVVGTADIDQLLFSNSCHASASHDKRSETSEEDVEFEPTLQPPSKKNRKGRTYVCTICGKALTSNQHYTEHMRIHTGEKAYRCKICGKQFRESSNLANHREIHTGEKLFMCKTCGKYFRLAGVLRCHMRIHSGEKPFTCKSCGKRFRYAGVLTRHIRTHR